MGNSFAKYIKRKRIEAGLSQKDVSDIMKWTTPQFLSNIERGISFPPMKMIHRLAKIYRISSTEIYNELEKAYIQKIEKDLRRRFDESDLD